MLHATAEVCCELRVGPWGGRPCAQGVPASHEQAKPWEPGEERNLHNRMAILGVTSFLKPCTLAWWHIPSPSGDLLATCSINTTVSPWNCCAGMLFCS